MYKLYLKFYKVWWKNLAEVVFKGNNVKNILNFQTYKKFSKFLKKNKYNNNFVSNINLLMPFAINIASLVSNKNIVIKVI